MPFPALPVGVLAAPLRSVGALPRRPLRSAGALVLVLAVAGCAGAAPDDAEPPAASAASVAPPSPTDAGESPSTAFPLTVQSCGVPVTLTGPPQRIVTIKSSATEMVLALGAGDRIVGTGFPDGPVPEPWTSAATGLPVLSDKVPSAEVVLGVAPDLVYAGWESNLTAEGAGDRETLHGLGVATYVSPSACKDPAHRPERLTFDEVFAEITEMAAVLGVPEAAEDLIADQRAVLESVEPAQDAPTALWYSSGTDVPYVGAGIGAPQMIMDEVGLVNVAAAIQDTWSAYSLEQLAEDDPDVIVLVDATWNTAEAKRELLTANPATANLTAVLNERYLVVPFAASEAGVRNAPAVADLADQLDRLDLG